MLSGICPDEKCRAKLSFPKDDVTIDCTSCGQTHRKSALQNSKPLDQNTALRLFLRNEVVKISKTQRIKRQAEVVKVRGLSNYHCKLLSPFLTHYGMDKKTGKACLLKDLNRGEVFDCSNLGNRAFLLEPEHLDTVGYGRDRSGSVEYLSDTLSMIREFNDGEENLVPIHADGDGHCLLHAVSRALVGRALFWHPLKICLKRHLEENIVRYKALLDGFILDWETIIAECDPDYEAREGDILGLQNVHIFGLANVLRRPIILLDTLSAMSTNHEVSGLFLPALVDPKDCRGKSGVMNKPLCIAWNSAGRNHFIPLVGVSSRRLPKLPMSFLPAPWGMAETDVGKYLESEDYFCTVGGDECLLDSYVQRLAAAMDEVYTETHGVHPSVVTDVHCYIYTRTGLGYMKPQAVLAVTQKAIANRDLYRCLLCNAVCIPWMNSDFYEMVGSNRRMLVKCSGCFGPVRLVKKDGGVQYRDGDRTNTVCQSNNCNCGRKHFWDGKEYENLPQMLKLTLNWVGRQVQERVPWFQNERDSAMNSNAYDVANRLIQNHFSGVFGLERLVQKVVQQILDKTNSGKELDRNIALHAEVHHAATWNDSPSKSTFPGFTTCEKELTKSEAEETTTDSSKIRERAAAKKAGTKIEFATPKPTPPKTPATLPSQNKLQNAPAKKQPTPKQKMIRVCTSNGTQLQLSLESIKTVDDLRQELEIKLGTPAARLRILSGFPPKEMPYSAAAGSEPHPFSPGDKLTVEAHPDSGKEALRTAARKSTARKSIRPALSQSPITTTFSDRLSTAVGFLALDASVRNRSFWSFAEKSPKLFLPRGELYRQMERDIGLIDGKHFQLPFLGDKVFVYNRAYDRVEICLEPHGHFPVAPGVVEKYSGAKPASGNKTQCMASLLSSIREMSNVVGDERPVAPGVVEKYSGAKPASGSKTQDMTSLLSSIREMSNVVGDERPCFGVMGGKAKEVPSHVPFQGQGHSLGGNPGKSGSVSDLVSEGVDGPKSLARSLTYGSLDLLDTLDSQDDDTDVIESSSDDDTSAV